MGMLNAERNGELEEGEYEGRVDEGDSDVESQEEVAGLTITIKQFRQNLPEI